MLLQVKKSMLQIAKRSEMIREKLTFKNITAYIKYMSGGIPAFLMAIALNWLLVDKLHIHVLLAYVFVLTFQIMVNFLICHYLVFNKKSKPTLKLLGEFSFYVLFFQGLTWITYAIMVKWLSIYYILAQLINIGVLSIFKFIWASRIFLKKP